MRESFNFEAVQTKRFQAVKPFKRTFKENGGRDSNDGQRRLVV